MGLFDKGVASTLGGGAVGSALGGAAFGGGGAAVGGLMGAQQGLGGVQKTLSQTFGMDNSKQNALEDQAGQMQQEQYDKTQGILGQMKQSDTDYQNALNKQVSDYESGINKNNQQYLGKVNQFANQAQDQATNAQSNYTNNIQPRLQGVMDDAQKNAAGAMTLQEASDPNNRVASAMRDMYNQQAQGVQKQGLADYGVLSALGAQATGNAMGGMNAPMTGAQMQLLGANNQQQASQAYNIAAQRMNALKQQGLEAGTNQSNFMYQQGQNAREFNQNAINNYQNSGILNANQQRNFRDEGMGYAGINQNVLNNQAAQNMGLNSSLAQTQENLAQGQQQKQMGAMNTFYGNQQQGIANQIAGANAQNAAKSGMLGGILQGGMTAAGSYFGGPGGAQAGSQMGGGIANGMMSGGQTPYAQPNSQYGSNPYGR